MMQATSGPVVTNGGGGRRKGQEYGTLPEQNEERDMGQARNGPQNKRRGSVSERGDIENSNGEEGEDNLGAGRASYGDDLETLDRRRTEELKLIGQYDS